jgi:hypothetical protein
MPSLDLFKSLALRWLFVWHACRASYFDMSTTPVVSDHGREVTTSDLIPIETPMSELCDTDMESQRSVEALSDDLDRLLLLKEHLAVEDTEMHVATYESFPPSVWELPPPSRLCELPTEIKLHVVAWLAAIDKPALTALARTCKDLYAPSLEALYHEVTLDSSVEPSCVDTLLTDKLHDGLKVRTLPRDVKILLHPREQQRMLPILLDLVPFALRLEVSVSVEHPHFTSEDAELVTRSIVEQDRKPLANIKALALHNVTALVPSLLRLCLGTGTLTSLRLSGGLPTAVHLAAAAVA